MSPSGGEERRETVRELLGAHGETYARQAGIRLRDTPQPLYQLLVLAHLLSARIRADVAVAAARALFDAGLKDPRRMRDASWQERVDALGAGGYRRYDERTSTQLGRAAQLVLDAYGGDLRRMHREAGDDPERLRGLLQGGARHRPRRSGHLPAGGAGGVAELAPYLDDRTLDGARRLGLPRTRRAVRSRGLGTSCLLAAARWCAPRSTGTWWRTCAEGGRTAAGSGAGAGEKARTAGSRRPA